MSIFQVLAFALLAGASPPPGDILTLEQVNARFLTRPFNRGYYPDSAANRHVEGEATILCRIRGDGTVNHCVVENQSPPKAGFGFPTIHYFSDLLVIDPVAKDGTPTAGRLIRLHKDWRITGGSAYLLH
jgi:hypothetical protein